MKILFWGATDEVTGSMSHIQLPAGEVIVDCGLTQGSFDAEKKNKLKLPFDPKNLEAIIITHAHLDHTGMIPKLVQKGFRGKIYCTPATEKLMKIILMDSAKLNEDEGFYDSKDVTLSLPLIKTYDWNVKFEVAGSKMHFIPCGHILGASSLVIENEGKKVVFSGDIGRPDDPILLDFDPCPKDADVVIMEATYGDRERLASINEDLEKFLKAVHQGKRIGIIASFAVARGQTLLTLIHQFYEKHPQYKTRVVMDSPMMKEANNVYKKYKHLTRHSEDLYEALENIDAIEYAKEWESLKKKEGPLVILASSGMITGGRISRHLLNWHQDKKAILFISGYQSENTPGYQLLKGNRTLLGPDDEVFEWQGEIWHSSAFSSHADQSELLDWVKDSQAQKIILIHGDTKAKITLRDKLLELGKKEVLIPNRNDEINF